jgi:hypothetical protein
VVRSKACGWFAYAQPAVLDCAACLYEVVQDEGLDQVEGGPEFIGSSHVVRLNRP